MNRSYHRPLELEQSSHTRFADVWSSLMASEVMRVRYHIIAILPLVGIVELVSPSIWYALTAVAMGNIVLLLWIGLLGATLLAWMGMAGLIIIERSIHYFSIYNVYRGLVVFPLIVVAEIGLISTAIALDPHPPSGVTALVFLSMSVSGVIAIVALIKLRSIMTSKLETSRLFVVAILTASIASSALWSTLILGLWTIYKFGGVGEYLSQYS